MTDLAAQSKQKSFSLTQLLFSYPMRLAAYGVIAAGISQVVLVAAERLGTDAMGAENGVLEVSQVCLAIFACLGLAYAATRIRRGRAGLIVCAAMVGYAAARECDAFFEAIFFDDAYKYFVGLPMLIIVLITVWIERERIIPDAMWLGRQPAITLFAIGGIYLCGVCNILDNPRFWATIEHSSELVATRAMVEEFAEAFAYMLLAFAGIEAIVMAHAQNRELTEQANPFADETTSTLRVSRDSIAA